MIKWCPVHRYKQLKLQVNDTNNSHAISRVINTSRDRPESILPGTKTIRAAAREEHERTGMRPIHNCGCGVWLLQASY